MNSIIVSAATRVLLPLLLLFSIFLLLRGHYEPGGGFVGGLVAASAFALYSIAEGVKKARELVPLKPHLMVIAGLAVALFSGIPGLICCGSFLKGVWAEDHIPVIGAVGTPLLFDVGVYMVVLGVTTLIIFNLADKVE